MKFGKKWEKWGESLLPYSQPGELRVSFLICICLTPLTVSHRHPIGSHIFVIFFSLFETPSPLLPPLLCTHYSRYILTIASSLRTSLALLDTEMLLQMVPDLQFFDFAMPVSWVITRVNIQNTTILFFSFSTGFKKLHETVHTLL